MRAERDALHAPATAARPSARAARSSPRSPGSSAEGARRRAMRMLGTASARNAPAPGEEQPDARGDPRGVDGAIADAVEPEQVGVEVLADVRDDVQDDQHRADDDERQRAAEPRGTPAAAPESGMRSAAARAARDHRRSVSQAFTAAAHMDWRANAHGTSVAAGLPPWGEAAGEQPNVVAAWRYMWIR